MWRTFKVRALYARNARTLDKEFYAPDLDTAFALARSEWPGACAWEYMGDPASARSRRQHH